MWQSEGVAYQGFNVIPQEKHGFKCRCQLQGEEEHQRVEGAGMSFMPAHDGAGNETFDGCTSGQESNAGPDEGAGNDVSRIVNAEIDARQAGDEHCPAKGKDTEAAGDKIEAHGDGNVGGSMIAGE